MSTISDDESCFCPIFLECPTQSEIEACNAVSEMSAKSNLILSMVKWSIDISWLHLNYVSDLGVVGAQDEVEGSMGRRIDWAAGSSLQTYTGNLLLWVIEEWAYECSINFFYKHGSKKFGSSLEDLVVENTRDFLT